MTLTVYHLKSCDTCRKAIKSLEAAGHELSLVDVRADGVPPSTLADIEQQVGWKVLLNTRSTTWRGLDDADKSDMTSQKALTLMDAHPTLIKRPVIVSQDGVTVGWSKTQQETYL